MIKTKANVPTIYYDQSRDFQLLGRLFDIATNHIKTNTDLVYLAPGYETNTGLVELLASTLGFKCRHEYNVRQLQAVCSILSDILKYKGTLQSLYLVCNALLRAENNTNNFVIQEDPEDSYGIQILLPKLQSITLLEDLLSYILPAGMCCTITETSRAIYMEPAITVEFDTAKSIKKYFVGDSGQSGETVLNPEDYSSIIADYAINDMPVVGDLTNATLFTHSLTGTTYKVSFNKTSGSGSMRSRRLAVKEGESTVSYTLPKHTSFNAPDGHKFAGWARTADGDIIDTETITITADTVLFAKWMQVEQPSIGE